MFSPHTGLINPMATLHENTKLDMMMRVLMNLHTTEPNEALLGPLQLTSSCHSSSSLHQNKSVIQFWSIPMHKLLTEATTGTRLYINFAANKFSYNME